MEGVKILSKMQQVEPEEAVDRQSERLKLKPKVDYNTDLGSVKICMMTSRLGRDKKRGIKTCRKLWAHE